MEQQLPTTLQQAILYFADNDNCVDFVKQHFFPNGEVCCIRCGSVRTSPIKGRPQFRCKDCKYDFSIKVNTIFEKSPLPLSTWLPALWLMANSKNAISSHELSRALGVTQKTAWFMSHRIREAMKQGSFQKLSGTVEADEAYLGGSDVFRHKNKKRGWDGKTAVFGAVERGGKVAAQVVDTTDEATLKRAVRDYVEGGAFLYTDQSNAYRGLGREYWRGTVNHSEQEYVRGDVHTNTIENFWSLFKRGLKGTHIHVAPFHLDRYIQDQAFRYNHRKTNDFGRFNTCVPQAQGRRITWNQLTGKTVAAR